MDWMQFIWDMHKQGRKGAFETLLTYNAEDVTVLPHLLKFAYDLEKRRMTKAPVRIPPVKKFSVPKLTTKPNVQILKELEKRRQSFY